MDKKAFTETAAGKQRTARRQRAERAPRDRRLVRQRMATCVRGLLFAGTGYLFGAAPIAFGACPLGLSLLAASSGYTWYILAGLILSALTQPSSLPAVAVIGVYVFCVLLRLAVLFFVDPPVLPGEAKQTGFRGSLRYAGRYLSLCLQSVGSNLGLETLLPRRRKADTETDYYTGSPWEKAERSAMQDSEEEDNPESRHTTESLPPPLLDRAGLFSEHPFLRTLTGAVAGFAAGVVGLFEGGFHVYDLLAALLMIFVTPVCVVLLTSCFGEAGETLLFSPHPLHGVTGADVPPGGYRRLLSRFRVMPLVACAALALGISFSTRSLSFTFGTPYLTVRLDTLLGILLTLSSVSRLGLVPGLATALLCGIGAGVNRMPLFLLTATVYAFLHVLSHRSAVIGGSLSGILWCAAYDDMTGFLTQLPAICLSVPVFFLLERLWERMPLSDSDGELAQSDFTLAVTGAVRLAAGQERLGAISQALLEMSDRFGEMAERQRRTGEQQLRQLCRETADAVCAGCPARADCRGVPEDSLLAGLRKRGRVDAAQLAAALPDHDGGHGLHRSEEAPEVGVHHMVIDLRRALIHGSRVPGTGVVHQDVHPTKGRHGLIHHPLGVLRLGDIHLEDGGLSAHLPDLGRHGLCPLPAAGIAHGHIGTLLGEAQGDLPADAVAGAGDDGHFILKSHVDTLPLQAIAVHVDGNAAVDDDGLAGNEVGLPAGQEDGRAGDVLRLSDALERREMDAELPVLRLVLQGLGEIRVDDAGGDGVHPDAELPQTDGGVAGEACQGTGGRGVGRLIRPA